MRDLGRIVRLQIQRASLKTGEKPTRVYDPTPLLAVDRLALGPDGALGEGSDGSWLVDVHHRAHPRTKNEDGAHGVSLGFTSHYALMRDRFGERITLGCAGENIIVETERRIVFADLEHGVALLAPDGRELARLEVLQVAEPCRPFSGWALGDVVEARVLKETLQFLEGNAGVLLHGRGFGNRIGGRSGGGVIDGMRDGGCGMRCAAVRTHPASRIPHHDISSHASAPVFLHRSQINSFTSDSNPWRWRHAGHTAYVRGNRRPTR